jgi:hypothetical protein
MPTGGDGFSPSERARFDGYSELHGPEGAELEKGPSLFYRVFQGFSRSFDTRRKSVVYASEGQSKAPQNG